MYLSRHPLDTQVLNFGWPLSYSVSNAPSARSLGVSVEGNSIVFNSFNSPNFESEFELEFVELPS